MSSTPRVTLVTLFPKMLEGPLAEGVVGQAIRDGLIQVDFLNPRDQTHDRHRTVDDRPFGGGDGMVMLVEPLVNTLKPLHERGAKLVYMSPQGPVLTSQKARELAQVEDLVLISGRYGGIDQRIMSLLPIEELSVGDYVLSGGEPAMWIVLDALARFVPGVLGSGDSANQDSFEGGVLECPQYTRPREILGLEVPNVLLSGDHKKISEFRSLVSGLITLQKRPDLFRQELGSNKKFVLKMRQLLDSLSEDERKVLGITLKPEELTQWE